MALHPEPAMLEFPDEGFLVDALQQSRAAKCAVNLNRGLNDVAAHFVLGHRASRSLKVKCRCLPRETRRVDGCKCKTQRRGDAKRSNDSEWEEALVAGSLRPRGLAPLRQGWKEERRDARTLGRGDAKKSKDSEWEEALVVGPLRLGDCASGMERGKT